MWGCLERGAVVQRLAADLDRGAGHGTIRLRLLEERVGVSVSGPVHKDPRVGRENLGHCFFSLRVFSGSTVVTPKYQLGCFVFAAGQDCDEQGEVA